MPDDSVRIAMWSGPRNLSTALMRSFENRSDTVVVDEPLYAHYLTVTGIDHPGRADILAAQSPSWQVVTEELTGPVPGGRRVWYQKHMTHHLVPEVGRGWLARVTNAFLIRDPAQVVASYAQVRGEPTLADLGFVQQQEIFERTADRLGAAPPVIDAADLLADPEGVLSQLCEQLGIDFEPAMLSWPAGPRSSDGVWAPYWYASVEASTGSRRPVPTRRSSRTGSRACSTAAVPATRRSPRSGSDPHRRPRLPDMLQSFDERNRDLLVSVGGVLRHRDEPHVSAFDSVVQGGDAVWEGLRLYDGRIFRLMEHLARLRGSARALAFAQVPADEEIVAEITRTLEANQMRDGVHIRLTLTRGVKITSGMDPRLNQAGPTLIVLAEHKPPVYDTGGIHLATASVRRPGPDVLDPKIHHNNLINSILAKIEANAAGADDALLLDGHGFVAETNATNVFAVVDGVVVTPTARACPEGITRAAVLGLLRDLGVVHEVRDVAPSELHRATEVFVTGTMGELVPVLSIDRRVIGPGEPGEVTARLTAAFRTLTSTEGVSVVA